MSDKNVKAIRNQLRNVVKESLPGVLTEELGKAVHTALKAHIDKRLDAIAKHLQTSLDAIDTRSKEVQSYLVRNTTPQAPTPKD